MPLLSRSVARCLVSVAVFALATPATGQNQAEWNRPQEPFRVFGNTWYVGPQGLSVLLITSARGHVLLDAALPESAPLIMANVERLGFKVEDIRLIVTSHVHFDHVGAVAELQRRSKARVAATGWSRRVLLSGTPAKDDPQFGRIPSIGPVPKVKAIKDGDVLRVGPIAITAHETGGHTPGGTSWSWRSCDDSGRCLDVVYADSLTAVSADGFRYTGTPLVAAFERGFRTLERLPCDILITPHPEASGLWDRVATRAAGDAAALIDRAACARYVEGARRRLQDRLASEAGK